MAENNVLKNHFPMIRDRESILNDIHSNAQLQELFDSWNADRQKEFLDFCSGVRGIKILYDSFFKSVFNVGEGKGNLIRLLSGLLGKKIADIELLPQNSKLSGAGDLVIMDIVVRLGDGSIVNVEIQKQGYKFPGQRAACYSADLVMRQYAILQEKAKEQAKESDKKAGDLFDYRDVMPVHTFIIIEHSSRESHFKDFPGQYVHRFRSVSDTGLEMELLQEYVFIPLDIFLPILHDKGIRDELDAWIAFLSTDDPAIVQQLLDVYPDIFRPIYEKLYETCLNTEGVMRMFSKALEILDRNTIMNMQEEMREQLRSYVEQLSKKEEIIASKDEELASKDEELASKDETIASLMARVRELEGNIQDV